MLVGYDFNIPANCGIDRYNRELVKHLPKYARDFRPFFLDRNPTAERRASHVIKNFIHNRFFAGKELRIAGVDIFHCTKNFMLPMFNACKIVTTIHDIIPIAFKDAYSSSLSYKIWYRTNYASSIKRSCALITISKFSFMEILKIYPECKKKLNIIYQGCDPNFSNSLGIDEAQTIMSSYGIDTPYVLTIGGAEPRKNVQHFVDAFVAMPPQDYQLVIIGNDWRGQSLKISSGDPVRILTNLSQTALAAAYTAASVFVFPSLYEGFGIPVLEAMACGTPVVAHNGSAMPEVVGNAGVLVDMHDMVSCMSVVHRLIKESSYADDLREAGKERILLFPWEKTAQQTAEVYEYAIEK